MEALARNIPVITVSERRLTAAHLTYDEILGLDRSSLGALANVAVQSLPADREAFGFAPATADEHNKNPQTRTNWK